MNRRLWISFWACRLAAGAPLAAQPAAEPTLKPYASVEPLPAELVETMGQWLAHPVLASDETMREAQAFAEPRVAVLPEFESLERWEAYAEKLRGEILDRIVFRDATSRAWRAADSQVEWLESIDGGPGYRVKKLRFEALPGMWIPALLYEPEALDGPAPVILNVNGHDGKGKAAPYKQLRCINQAKRGMIALNVEWLGMGQLQTEGFHHARMNQLDLCGVSGLAPFYLSLERSLDVLLAHPNADPDRTAVMGLSGGGWQTIVVSALDPRVVLSNPVAGYSSYRTRARQLSDLGDSEQTPTDLAALADYTHLTALRAPRPTLLTYNKNDECCFASDHALPPLLASAGPIFALHLEEGRLRAHVNEDPGTHNFEIDNRQAMYRMVGDYFFAGQSDYPANEIPSDDEIKTAEELNVALPEGQEDFHTLAMKLAADLPHRSTPAAGGDADDEQHDARRKELGGLVRYPTYTARGEMIREEQSGRLRARWWKLSLDGGWSIPALELLWAWENSTAILVADGGFASAADEIADLLAARTRVIAIDPYYFGQCKVAERDYLFSLLIAGVGERPLGVQAGQIAAAARWAGETFRPPVDLAAVGPRTGLAAIVAAAIETAAIGDLMLKHPRASLKTVIEENLRADHQPEQFCFGLLEKFEVGDLLALVQPRRIYFVDPDDSVRALMAGLGESESGIQ